AGVLGLALSAITMVPSATRADTQTPTDKEAATKGDIRKVLEEIQNAKTEISNTITTNTNRSIAATEKSTTDIVKAIELGPRLPQPNGGNADSPHDWEHHHHHHSSPPPKRIVRYYYPCCVPCPWW